MSCGNIGAQKKVHELEAGLMRSQADSERLIRAVLTIVEVDLFLDKKIDDFEGGRCYSIQNT
ncbi:MAG TPA: hypothetical protein VF354_03650 [Candidatus Methanoperedens sp.]